MPGATYQGSGGIIRFAVIAAAANCAGWLCVVCCDEVLDNSIIRNAIAKFFFSMMVKTGEKVF